MAISTLSPAWQEQSRIFADGPRDTGKSMSGLEGHIASSDLLNPSDALDLLAQVADLQQNGQLSSVQVAGREPSPAVEDGTTPLAPVYPPVASRALSLVDVLNLVRHYQHHYHPFFPIAYPAIFEPRNIVEWFEKEEHLVTAILIVASKEDQTWFSAHEACSRHMEGLISKLIYTGSTIVGAIEALLILAEWAPFPPSNDTAIGSCKEDQEAWMMVGMAIRLGYLQKLEQAGLNSGQEPLSQHASRQRIAWAACYMSDRQISLRLGKGFWSRGPGPSTHFGEADLASLTTQSISSDNLALLFQANLELTQIFSNAHDILYSSTRHRGQLYLGGEWRMSWGNLSFTPPVKASLMLTYDFLRLYINAFAFQANLNHAVRLAFQESPKAQIKRRWLADIAGAPDARFIYESIDAAKSLLGTINDIVDPETELRYMPLKYYLYAIYAAVFLFKAILAGAITSSDAAGVCRAVQELVDRLQKTSSDSRSLGHRYARSLCVLWQKLFSSERTKRDNTGHGCSTSGYIVASGQHSTDALSKTEVGEGSYSLVSWDSLDTFSWRDLDFLERNFEGDIFSNTVHGVLRTPEFVSDWSPVASNISEAGFWNERDFVF